MHDTFFFTDLHGQRDLFHAMYDWCVKQDSECTVVYGGDAADRGAHGYEIMRELLDLPNVIYLKGNHEDMFVKACDAIIGKYACLDETYKYLHSHLSDDEADVLIQEMYFQEDVWLAIQNGGWPTLADWIKAGADEEIVDRIRDLPYTYRTDTIDFCHSAYLPTAFEDVAQAEYKGEAPNSWAVNGLIWDRKSLNYGWTTDRIAVFGHTPTCELNTKINHGMNQLDMKPCAWHSLVPSDREKRAGWKIDMDTCATFTGRAYVLNTNTMTVYGFYDPMVQNPYQEAVPIEEAFENYKII